MKSKIHPFAVFFTLVTILLSVPAFLMAYRVVDDFMQNQANIFFVIMLFFGLLSITFFVFGWKNLRQISFGENAIEERWLGRFVVKRLYHNSNTSFSTENINYRVFQLEKTIIEDEKGQQIRFNNLDFRNNKEFLQYLKENLKQNKLKLKIELIDKVFIGLFIAASLWIVITGSMKMIF